MKERVKERIKKKVKEVANKITIKGNVGVLKKSHLLSTKPI